MFSSSHHTTAVAPRGRILAEVNHFG